MSFPALLFLSGIFVLNGTSDIFVWNPTLMVPVHILALLIKAITRIRRARKMVKKSCKLTASRHITSSKTRLKKRERQSPKTAYIPPNWSWSPEVLVRATHYNKTQFLARHNQLIHSHQTLEKLSTLNSCTTK